MSKQDRQGARTASDLEYKYQFGKTFAEIMGIANDARDRATAAEEAYNGLNQEEIFNRLTNDGKWKGLYEENGEVYINASYIKSGEFVADLIKAGVLQSVDGETFKLDLDNGTLSLKSGGNEVMNVSRDGASLSGWNVSRDYLGTRNCGLNGNITWTNAEEGNQTVRFYAGANKTLARRYVQMTATVDNNGVLYGVAYTTFLMSEIFIPNVVSIQCLDPFRDLSESDFDENEPLTFTRINGNLISMRGKLTDETLKGKRIAVQVEVNACVPAFQVLDDGALIVDYAKVGGVSIADLIKRIEALEAK